MASSQEPDDDFGVRVQKVFGSLAPIRSSDSTSLWSVSDTEVENRGEKRETGGDEENDVVLGSEDREGLEAVSGGGRMEADGGVEDRGDGEVENAGAGDGEEWDIRSSIGMDRTLDGEVSEFSVFSLRILCLFFWCVVDWLIPSVCFGDCGFEMLFLDEIQRFGPELNCFFLKF